MGVERPELVLIESWDHDEKTPEAVDRLRAEMPEEFRGLVVGPIPAVTNGYVYWAFFPDGSKEFWITSDAVNIWRSKFKALAPYPDGAIHIAWGDEDREFTDESWSDNPDADPETVMEQYRELKRQLDEHWSVSELEVRS